LKYLLILLAFWSSTGAAFTWTVQTKALDGAQAESKPVGEGDSLVLKKADFFCMVTSSETSTSGDIFQEWRFLACGVPGGFTSMAQVTCSKALRSGTFIGGLRVKDLVVGSKGSMWIVELRCGP
jgi:hypothetical protein